MEVLKTSTTFNSVSSYLSRPRFLYATTFLWLTVTGGRFLAPFLEHEGGHMNAEEIGTCLALQQMVITIASSFGGAWADIRESQVPGYGRAQVVVAGVLLSTVAFVLHGVHHLFGPGNIFQASDDVVEFFRSLPWHALLQCFQGLGVANVFPVLDGMTIKFLDEEASRLANGKNESGRQDYGKERLHGPLWWSLSNVLLSTLLDRYGFSVCYLLAVLGLLLVAWSTWVYTETWEKKKSSVPITNDSNRADERTALVEFAFTRSPEDCLVVDSGSTEAGSDDGTASMELSLPALLSLLLTSAYGIAFCFCIVCISSGQATVDNLVFLFFEALGSSWLLMGLTVVVKISFEVPMFYYGPIFLRRYGASSVLLLGCACYFVRVVTYPFIPEGKIIYAVMLEPLHGITYASSQLAMVQFVADAMPPGYEASGQGLIALFKDGGSVLGVYVGGLADSQVGTSLMFGISAAIVLTGAVVLSVTLSIFGKHGGRSREVELIPDIEDATLSKSFDKSFMNDCVCDEESSTAISSARTSMSIRSTSASNFSENR